MKHIIFTRFSYSDEELFKARIRITKTVMIPSLIKQKNQNFVWGISTSNNEHRKIIQSFYNKEILFFLNQEEFKKYIKENSFDIQTRHDSDDYMDSSYTKLIQRDYENNKKDGRPFLIHFEPSKYELSTGKIYSMSNYEKRNSTSAFISLCPMGSDKTILDHWHNRWVGNIDFIVRNRAKNCVMATIHDNNTSTKISKVDKTIGNKTIK